MELKFLGICSFLLLFNTVCYSWPDGAPCIHAVFESMNPLEAVEHQGGLQLTDPPYKIDVREKCYWKNQPIELSLKGNTSTDRFRGFAIQPFSYRGPHQGRRIGQFLRLDDNGSWQQECFRFKNSVTHSHDEKKKNIKLWWKNEHGDEDYVQFIATVVKAQKEFWVKSVRSVPIPPCRIESRGIQDYVPDPITAPPPVKQFKLDTFRMFDALDNDLQHNLLDIVPNDADRKPKAQRVQDFFKVMHISNHRLPHTLAPQSSVQASVPQVSATVTQPQPAPVAQLQPNLQRNQLIGNQEVSQQYPPQRYYPNQAISSPNLAAVSSSQPPAVLSVAAQLQSLAHPDTRAAASNPLPQTSQRIFAQPNPAIVDGCRDLIEVSYCMSRIVYCNMEYMRINCRRTCRLC